MAVQKIITATLVGIEAALVEVEADVSNGLPATIIVGLPDTAIQESRERVRSAIKHSGYNYPQARIALNLAPGSLPKIGTHFDVPIALAILLSSGLKISDDKLHEIDSSIFVGELSLDGTVRSSAGILAMVDSAKKKGYKFAFVPKDNADMAALVKNIGIYPYSTLQELLGHFITNNSIQIFHPIQNPSNFSAPHSVDFLSIAGQESAKRALEISASGGHNLLMTGPPGSGKTMLAKALPSIMPPLSSEEVLELTKIYNSAGKIRSGIIRERPVRSPHHTASQVALIGGGTVPRPGEITLAHRGVLFMDEFPEFSRVTLEVLRQPLEENKITITRLRHTYQFPARFILVAAQNPCPCGNFDQPKLECLCLTSAILKYRKKISGPLLDRIDLHINVPRLNYKEFSETASSESSEVIAKRVARAREIQTRRYKHSKTNSQMTVNEIKKYCALNISSQNLLEVAVEKYQLSGRSIHRILKVARTIADLANSGEISVEHISESLHYRQKS